MKRVVGIAAVFLLASMPQLAHGAVQLQYTIGGRPTPVAWDRSAFPVTITLDESSGASGQGAVLDETLALWSDESDALVSFTATRASGAVAGQDGRNLVALADDLMADSGFMAYTTTWFDDDGVIRESDIQIDRTAVQKGTVGALLRHEIGHLLGFDHNANLGSVMYPFVSGDSVLGGSDRIGLVALYPRAGQSGRITISGTVRASDGPVLGSHIVAVNDDGIAVSSTVSDAEGRFTFRALPDAAYRLYAEPLDGPVEARNMDGVFRHAATGYRTTFALDAAGKSGDILIQVDDLPARLNPRWIGAFAPGDSPRLESHAVTVRPGMVVDIAVGGDGIIGGLTDFTIESAQFERTGELRYGANYMWATYRVGNDAKPGPVVVLVRTGNEAATLTGGVIVAETGTGTSPGRRRGVTRPR